MAWCVGDKGDMAVRERWNGTSPISLTTRECVDVLVPATVADARIEAVYLFGSRAVGEGDADSDVDFAIYTTDEYGWDDLFALRGKLTGLLRTERLDLVWLNEAKAGVAFSVVRDGRLLHYADADRLNEFERRVIWRYRDRALYLQGRRNRRHGISA